MGGIGYLSAVLWVTLGPVLRAPTRIAELPFGVLNPATWLSPTTWTTGSPAEFTLNILLFIPLGALAYQLLGRHIGILLPIALTVLIEIAQIALPDRASDPRDLLANILGSLLGILLAWSVSRRRLRTKKT